MKCDHRIQTPAGLMSCQETIEHTHIGPGSAEPVVKAAQVADMSEVWKAIEYLKEQIKRLTKDAGR